ncbi:ATP-binding protein [Streptomyces sp. NBC_01390]|uniref:ATP-binding protein n=1 Tax=Streptomyces sp. NBC_01390 TaxID=2903850 RepID=UPI0032439B3C
MISHPSRHCTVELQALPSRIGQVRRIVSAHLRYWHLDPLIDRASLGVTELLTNVHRHAQPDKLCTVEIEVLLDRLTVSVHDHDPRIPELRDADPTATCGRGLAMVAAVSESWGVRPDGESGKVVWFTLPTVAPVVAAPETRPATAAPAQLPFEEQPCDGPGFDEPPYDKGHKSGAVRRRPEHAPARSAVVG